jgi:hypothetical protein
LNDSKSSPGRQSFSKGGFSGGRDERINPPSVGLYTAFNPANSELRGLSSSAARIRATAHLIWRLVRLLAASFAKATCTWIDRPAIEPIVLTHVDLSTDFRELFMHEKDDRTETTAIDARGARLGRPVLVVLIVSTLAVIGIFSLLYYGTYG